MVGPRQWRVVHEPGALAPWIVQVSTPGGAAWVDYRRFANEAVARSYTTSMAGPPASPLDDRHSGYAGGA